MVSGKPVVCFVEDDPNDIFLIGRALVVANLRVHSVFLRTYEELATLLDQSTAADDLIPNAIVTDLKLNGYSGFDVLKLVKGTLTFRHIPTLVLTSSELAHDRERAMLLGADRFISKPASNRLLAHSLVESLSPYVQQVACAA